MTNYKKIMPWALSFGYSALPLLASAATLTDFLNKTKDLLSLVIPILFILATIVFLWGIVVFLTAAGDPEKVKEGRGLMLWGIIALAVMSAAWGLTKVLTGTFGVEKGTIPTGF